MVIVIKLSSVALKDKFPIQAAERKGFLTNHIKFQNYAKILSTPCSNHEGVRESVLQTT